MTVEENKAILRQAAAAFNTATGRSGWLAIHDRSVVAHGLAPQPLDYAGMEQFYAGLWRAFPDLRIEIEDMVGEGEMVAWRLKVSGTHRAEFRGIPATGTAVTFTAQYVFRFENGRIVERWTNIDRLGVLSQLGAVALPA